MEPTPRRSARSLPIPLSRWYGWTAPGSTRGGAFSRTAFILTGRRTNEVAAAPLGGGEDLDAPGLTGLYADRSSGGHGDSHVGCGGTIGGPVGRVQVECVYQSKS